MLGISSGVLSDWNGKPTPWNSPNQVKFALSLHQIEDLRGGEVLNPDDEALAQISKMLGQAGVGFLGQSFDVAKGRCRASAPIELDLHDSVVGEVFTPTKPLTARPAMRDA